MFICYHDLIFNVFTLLLVTLRLGLLIGFQDFIVEDIFEKNNVNFKELTHV